MSTATALDALPEARRTGPSVAVVGGGFGGIAAAVMLRRAGHDDVTVFERGERVGGVWHHNTYPGAACDIPSHLYEFSFAPNPHWSRGGEAPEESRAST
jgi:cation diffusion facilitator CzcD-associated flavoprotein CzcO